MNHPFPPHESRSCLDCGIGSRDTNTGLSDGESKTVHVFCHYLKRPVEAKRATFCFYFQPRRADEDLTPFQHFLLKWEEIERAK